MIFPSTFILKTSKYRGTSVSWPWGKALGSRKTLSPNWKWLLPSKWKMFVTNLDRVDHWKVLRGCIRGKVCFDFVALAKLFRGICVYCYVSCLYCSLRKCKNSSFNFMFLFLIEIFVNSILNDFEHPILFFREPPGFPGIKKVSS